jgi:hypothetical protein
MGAGHAIRLSRNDRPRKRPELELLTEKRDCGLIHGIMNGLFLKPEATPKEEAARLKSLTALALMLQLGKGWASATPSISVETTDREKDRN